MELSKKIITAVAALSLVLTPIAASAQIGKIQEGLGKAATQGAGYTYVDPPTMVGRVIGYALGLLGIVLLGMLIYGGFLWMIAQGEDKKVTDARKTITNAIIGLVIVVMAYSIASYVVGKLSESMGGATGEPGGSSGGSTVSTPK